MNSPRRLVLLGHPVAHSLSPLMHNAALASAGIGVRYEAIDVMPNHLPRVMDSLARERAAGNVTVPHKQAAMKAMKSVSPIAKKVNAINTFQVSDDGDLQGDNTDVAGFNALVSSVIGEMPSGARVAVVGAGGAAAAVLASAEEWNSATVKIYARRPDVARDLAQRFKNVTGVEMLPVQGPLDCDIVVNATTIGLYDERLPVPIDALPGSAVILDLVYKPGETAWVRAARAAGHTASDGLEMLVEQGAASFEIWFGRSPDREAMWKAVTEASGLPQR
ncbi:MAG: shikimate dehydrogenase [Gemmatimonadaceae bacterium]